MEKYTIDANGKSVGRIATEAALCLMGKKQSGFKKNVVHDVEVKVVNASKLRIPAKKLSQKTYTRYSGYPGGLKQPTMAEVIEKKGVGEVVRHAIHGMLPKNTLRPKRMKRLTVIE
ncbi:MAG: 50S ribosomal protein L13 [bacterium]|nr:50S ribosomal protein L13 [bacterium]